MLSLQALMVSTGTVAFTRSRPEALTTRVRIFTFPSGRTSSALISIRSTEVGMTRWIDPIETSASLSSSIGVFTPLVS